MTFSLRNKVVARDRAWAVAAVAAIALSGCIGEPFSTGSDPADDEVGTFAQPDGGAGGGPGSTGTDTETGSGGGLGGVGSGGGPSCPTCEQGVCEGGDCRPALSCAELAVNRPALGSGIYSLKPEGVSAPFDAYCDLETAGVGWTRVLRVELGITCTFDENATDQDPSLDSVSCSKLSDEIIRALSVEKIFVSRVDGYDPTFTKFDGSVSASSPPGKVLQRGTYEAAKAATVLGETTYGYWHLFHQHDFYGPTPCMGGPGGSARLAMEYAVGGNGSYTYAVVGDCATMGTDIAEGHADVLIR